ncbi:MAG: sugar nucleotide-binding protein, partial [Candidatus Sedimenticola sp. (ex Thyasira tokunagai)]
TTEEYPTPATRPKNSVLDSQRINEIFGVEQPDWRQGLDRVLRAQVSGFK